MQCVHARGEAGARIPAEQVVRIKNQHPILRYDGYSVLTAMSRIVDTIEGVDQARLSTQQRGIDPSACMTFDPQTFIPLMNDIPRLRAQLEAINAGPANAGKIWINPFGGDIKPFSHAPKDMAWESGWEQLVSFVLAAFGTPKGVAGMSDDDSFATLWARLKQYYIISLCPLLRKISGKHTKHVLRKFFGPKLYMKLTPERIDDRELLEKQLTLDCQIGLRTKNEMRKIRELPPIEGPEGDEWAKTGAGQQQPGQEQMGAEPVIQKGPRGAGRVEEKPEEIEQARPRNLGGLGALGPRKIKMQEDRMAAVLDRAKRNGHARPIEEYNDGAADYLKHLQRTKRS